MTGVFASDSVAFGAIFSRLGKAFAQGGKDDVMTAVRKMIACQSVLRA